MNAPISRIAWRRRAAASLALGVVTTAFLIAPTLALPAAAAPVDDPVVASGDDWSVTDLGGVYEVEVELDRPLEMRSDAPTIEVDGEAVGFARESADGKKLTVLTSDPIVRDPEDVEPGWFAEAGTAEEVVADVPAVESTPIGGAGARRGSRRARRLRVHRVDLPLRRPGDRPRGDRWDSG